MRSRLLSRIVSRLFLLGILASTACARTKAQRIDALMAHYHALGHFHGSVLVAQHGAVLYEGGFGMADATWRIPNAPDTKFRIGSITKHFTGLMVLQQVQRGTLRLDAPLAAYLPRFPVPIDPRITLEHLLTHRSGLVDYANDVEEKEYDARYGGPSVRADTILADMLRRPLQFAPGDGYHYSNTAFVALGLVLEAVTGTPFCALLSAEILEPAGMTDGGCTSFEEIAPRLATGYAERDGRLVHVPFVHGVFADGVMHASVRDFLRLDAALRAGRLLSEPMQALMNTPRAADDWIGNDYGAGLRVFHGYGVEVHRRPGYPGGDSITVLGYGGGLPPAWSAMLWRVPEHGIVIAALNNKWAPPLYVELFDILYDRPYRLPTAEALRARMSR